MMAFPPQPSNQKWYACLVKRAGHRPKIGSLLIFCLSLVVAPTCRPITADQPPAGKEHELEELGVNRYTAPSIAQIFKQLDELKPLPFDEVNRNPAEVAGASRQQRALLFGE